jgi:DNA-binding NtrC family response regulator
MDDALKILMLEDVAADAELILRALQRGGVQCRARVVASEADFRRGLDEFEPDIILSDFALPHFDGMSALRMARARRPDTPFLFVSGTIGEERAVETLKEGASDYVIKDSLQRLPVAVQKALEAQRLRVAKREMEEVLRESEARHRRVVESVMECIITVDERQCIVLFNPAAERLFGYARRACPQIRRDRADQPCDGPVR